METINKRTTDERVIGYNNDQYQALTKALSYGSLKTQRSTLADLAGLAVNDNQKGE